MTDDLALNVVRMEAEAVKQTETTVLSSTFQHFVKSLTQLRSHGNKLIVTGVGKSAIAARKIAGTMATANIPAVFIDPIGLYHGELGVVVKGDMMLMVSHSGMTDELTRLIDSVTAAGAEIYSLVSAVASTLGQLNNAIVTGIDREAFSRIPTCSSAAAVAVGDAAACAAAQLLGYDEKTLASVHPGGDIGRRLKNK